MPIIFCDINIANFYQPIYFQEGNEEPTLLGKFPIDLISDKIVFSAKTLNVREVILFSCVAYGTVIAEEIKECLENENFDELTIKIIPPAGERKFQ